jgi:hypothetical protein
MFNIGMVNMRIGEEKHLSGNKEAAKLAIAHF